MIKCALCHDEIDVEHPDTFRGVNPLTLRLAWMELWCCRDAEETLTPEQRERYIEHIQNTPEY